MNRCRLFSMLNKTMFKFYRRKAYKINKKKIKMRINFFIAEIKYSIYLADFTGAPRMKTCPLSES